MAVSAALGLRSHLGYITAHAIILASTVGMLFLQRNIWLLRIAEQGYGPYQSASYLIGVSAVIILIDLFILRWALRGSRIERFISLLWPTLFFATALFVLVVNNV